MCHMLHMLHFQLLGWALLQEAEKASSIRRVNDDQDLLASIEKAYWKGIPGHTIYGAYAAYTTCSIDGMSWDTLPVRLLYAC